VKLGGRMTAAEDTRSSGPEQTHLRKPGLCLIPGHYQNSCKGARPVRPLNRVGSTAGDTAMRVEAGEGARFGVLSELRPLLLRRAESLCRGRSHAEDLVQDVLVSFMQSFRDKPLPSQDLVLWWLYRALRNTFVSRLRSDRVRAAKPVDDPDLLESAEPPAAERPEPELWMQVTDEELQQAMEGLSEHQRRVFQAITRGLSYREIAQELGVREGTVGKRLFDARRAMRAALVDVIERRTGK